MKVAYVFLMCSLLLVACDSDFELAGVDSTETRMMGDILRVDIDVISDVQIEAGSTTEVIVTTDENYQKEVETEVEDGLLKVRLGAELPDGVDVRILVRCPNLSLITKDGLGDLTVSGFVEGRQLAVVQRGLGDIRLSGVFEKIVVSKEGIGDFDSYETTCESVEISQSGLGDSRVQCSESLSGAISGSGNLFFRGMPTVTVEATGSGEVIDDN